MPSIPPRSAWDGGGGAEGMEQPLTPLLAQPLTECPAPAARRGHVEGNRDELGGLLL